MYKQSVWTSVISSQLAAKHMNEGGLLLLTGAKAALSGTPGETVRKELKLITILFNCMHTGFQFQCSICFIDFPLCHCRHDWLWNGPVCMDLTHALCTL